VGEAAEREEEAAAAVVVAEVEVEVRALPCRLHRTRQRRSDRRWPTVTEEVRRIHPCRLLRSQ
jgi:hypothetical protein